MDFRLTVPVTMIDQIEVNGTIVEGAATSAQELQPAL